MSAIFDLRKAHKGETLQNKAREIESWIHVIFYIGRSEGFRTVP